jgi:hypothetical protein
MKQYTETQSGSFTINGMTIPNNAGNRHYNQMIQEVADAEAEILPYVAPPTPIPSVVTMRQARLALLKQGLLSNVDVAINSLSEPQKSQVQIEWEYSQTVERDRPFVSLLGTALGLTDTGLDELFTLAATL